MKLKPLKEILAMSKQALDESLAPLRARKVKAKAEMKLADNEAKLLEYETRITQACAKEDIDFDNVIDLIDEHELLTRRNEQLKRIVADLFPANSTRKSA
ncbi:MAG: hypothetical protein EKK53_26715 [Burkholderiales bacterium]|nr:MAG: hypothetical protein EKK53_26715 [Burkholderiales bacterium]